MKHLVSKPSDRERFLAAVAEHVPLDEVADVYLFQPIRQGGVESGVAIIAAARRPETAQELDAPVGTGDAEVVVDTSAPDGRADEMPDETAGRYTVFTAHYRHVLKGPERGRWEVTVVAEADAPRATVGAVVRGVQQRAGDAEPPEHLSGDSLRDALGRGESGAP